MRVRVRFVFLELPVLVKFEDVELGDMSEFYWNLERFVIFQHS